MKMTKITRSERCRQCKYFSEDNNIFVSVIHCKKGKFTSDNEKEMNNNFTKYIEHGSIDDFPIECSDFEDNI